MRARHFKGSRLSDRQEESISVVLMQGRLHSLGCRVCLGEHCGLLWRLRCRQFMDVFLL